MKFLAVVAFVAVLGMTAAAPSRSLHDDFMDFAALIPVEEIRAVAREYIANDAEVQRALAYLKSDEWASLVAHVREHPSWIDFKDYMNEAGIDIEGLIKLIHDLIANAGAKNAPAGVNTRSMRDFIDAIKDLIPEGELLLLLNEKLTNSADFQAFWTEISSDKAYNLVEEVRHLDEVQHVVEVLKEMGLDIALAAQTIYELLGWEWSN